MAKRILPKGTGRQWVEANYLPNESCVIWPFGVRPNGYGNKFWVGDRYIAPHAYATELRDGPCPPGLIARHGPCHSPLCISHVIWGTYAENAADKVRDGTEQRGERHGGAKLTTDQVREIRRLLDAKAVQTEIAARFGVTPQAITLIKQRKNWSER